MNVVNAIVVKDSKILLIKRSQGLHAEKWAFPGGNIEPGETILEALKRELKEETNLNLKKLIRKIAEYNYKRDNENILGSSWLVEAPGSLKINSESKEANWFSLEELEDLDTAPGISQEALKALYEK